MLVRENNGYLPSFDTHHREKERASSKIPLFFSTFQESVTPNSASVKTCFCYWPVAHTTPHNVCQITVTVVDNLLLETRICCFFFVYIPISFLLFCRLSPRNVFRLHTHWVTSVSIKKDVVTFGLTRYLYQIVVAVSSWKCFLYTVILLYHICTFYLVTKVSIAHTNLIIYLSN